MIKKIKFVHCSIFNLVLVSLFILGLALRLWGVSFGLPYEYHPDEVQYVRQAAAMGQRGLEPTWWNNPPFYKYVYFGEYGVYYIVGKLAGIFNSVSDFGTQNSNNPTVLYQIGRITTAILGAFTIIIIYFLGSEVSKRKVGILSAFLLSVCFLHVRDSHYAVNDVPATFFVTLGLYFALRIFRSNQWRWYLLGGIVTGVGIATKYTAGIIILPLIMAHVLSDNFHWNMHDFKKIVVLGVSTLISAIVVSPFFLLRIGTVYNDIYEALINPGKNGFDGWLIDASGGFLF